MIPRLQLLAYSIVISTYVLMVIGSYVSSSGAGSSCPDWPTCNGQIVPQLTGGVVIEYTHRLLALVVVVLLTAMFILVGSKYRAERTVLALTTLGFSLIIAQILLGMVTVRTGLDPAIVAAHLGLASAVFGVVLVDAIAVRRIPQNRVNALS